MFVFLLPIFRMPKNTSFSSLARVKMKVTVRVVMVVMVRLSQGEGHVLPQQLWLPMCPFVQLPLFSREQLLPRETSPQAGEKI